MLVVVGTPGCKMSGSGRSDSKPLPRLSLLPIVRKPLCEVLNPSALQGPGKKWEHYDLTKNGKPVRLPMHVQRGDMVQVISGAQKGKTGKITSVSFCVNHAAYGFHDAHAQAVLPTVQVLTKSGQIVVDGINLKVKIILLLHVPAKPGVSVVDPCLCVQTKHNKPRAEGETGQITQNEAPIHHSNVMLYSEGQKVRSKVGHRYGCR